LKPQAPFGNADQQTAESTEASENIFKMIENGQYKELEALMGGNDVT